MQPTPHSSPGDAATVVLPKTALRAGIALQVPAAERQGLTEHHWIQARGGNGGERFELRRSGQKVKQLTLWGDTATLRGVQVEFADGAQRSVGALSGEWSVSVSFLSLMSRSPEA